MCRWRWTRLTRESIPTASGGAPKMGHPARVHGKGVGNMKAIGIVWLMTLIILAGAGTADAQKVKDGFKGIKWGTHITEMPGDLFQKPAERFDSTLQRGEQTPRSSVRELGGVELHADECWLKSYDGKFYGISVSPYHCYEETRFRDILISVYGKPSGTRLDSATTTYTMNYRKRVLTDKYVLLEWDEGITYRSFEMERQMRANGGPYRVSDRCGNFIMYSKKIRGEVAELARKRREERKKADSIALEKAKDDF